MYICTYVFFCCALGAAPSQAERMVERSAGQSGRWRPSRAYGRSRGALQLGAPVQSDRHCARRAGANCPEEMGLRSAFVALKALYRS